MPALLISSVLLAVQPVEAPLTGDAKLIFASVDQGRAVLRLRDAYAAATGPLERQIRLGSQRPVSVDEHLAYAADQVVAWDEEQIKQLTTVAAALQERLKPFDLPLPGEVLLLRTTGKEESGAAYTRGRAIVLSDRRLKARGSALERLLLHELFHVLSRHSPEVRKRLYALIGFQRCNHISLPDDLQAIRLTNPDAPTLDYYITVDHDDQRLAAVPVLLSNRQAYDPAVKSLFGYLEFKLMVIEKNGGAWQPLLRDGQPVLIDGRTNESYRRQIGENTGYIIHPDEILADNFVHLVMRTKDLPTPEIVDAMKGILMTK